MKITSILFGFTVGLLLMIVFPYFLLQANEYLELYSFDNAILKIIGILLILTGSGLFIHCSRIFKIFGKGTPVPIEPPKKIVYQNLYQFVRNPMYVGYFAIVVGEGLFFGATLLFVYSVFFILPYLKPSGVSPKEASLFQNPLFVKGILEV